MENNTDKNPTSLEARYQEVSVNRFVSKIMYEPNTGCWFWTAGLHRGKYGKFWVDKKEVRAHRFSYELYNGDIPANLFICHSCDNPACVNPNHLFLGTHQDNMDDMAKKGRRITICGSYLPQSKINEYIANDIRVMAKNGVSQSVISKKFNIAQPTVSDIINNKTWKKT